MKLEKILGILFTTFSLFILTFSLKLTGAVVGISYTNLSFSALIFLVVGLALFLHGNRLDLLSKRIIDDPRELRHIANKLGYHNGREAKEGYEVINDEGRILTVIPRHGPITIGTYHNIKESLISGKPNFRKRYSD